MLCTTPYLYMKKKNTLLLVFALLAGIASAQNLSYQKIYDNYVQCYVAAPDEVKLGETFNIVVSFLQTATTSPFNKNGDMSKSPVFPAIDGLVRTGEPKKLSTSENHTSGAKITSKSYTDRFTYTMIADKPGTYNINNIKMTFRGHTVTADGATITVKDAPRPSAAPAEKGEAATASDREPQVFSKPFVGRKTAPRATIEAVKLYADRTEVDVTYISNGENVYSSSECYIQDTNTKEHVKMRFMRGDVGYDKKWFASGKQLRYTMVFPPIKDSWRNINVIENVSGGFRFFDIGLARKPAGGKVRSAIAKIDYSQMRRVTLNDYSSDFTFTDGMLPVYNKDLLKWGFYNEQGDLAVDFVWDYDTFATPHFGGGYCIVSKVEKRGGFYYTTYFVIDKTGRPLKLAGVEKVTPFCEGIAAVVNKSGKLTYIKGNGQELSPALAQYIGDAEPKPVRPFKDGLSVVYDYYNERYGYIDKSGAVIVPAVFEEAKDFSEGLAAVKFPATASKAAAWGFINTKGQTVIEPIYSREPSSFSQGLAVVVKRSGREVMINQKGEVVSPEFQWLFPFFSTGYALANPVERQGMFVIDKNYSIVAGPVYGVEGKHRSYAEHHGAFQTPVFGPGYADAYSYLTTGEPLFGLSMKQTGVMSDNLIHVRTKEGDCFVDYNGKAVFMFVPSEF